MKDYRIQFSGLAEGEHEFAFVLEKPFFDLFEEEEIRDGHVDVTVMMEKQTRMLLFSFNIKGLVEVVCDRCADPLKIAVEGAERLIARIGEGGESTDDDIVFILEEDFEIDLSQHLFDYVHLLLPMRLTHDESADGRTCDPEMIRLLEKYTAEKHADTSWTGLEKLLGSEGDDKKNQKS